MTCPTPVMALRVVLPLKIVSLANQREHWRVAGKRKQEQQRVTSMCLTPYLSAEMRGAAAWRVKLTRVGRGQLDDDNLAGSFKHVRDRVALALGVDDGNRARIRFRYRQRKGSPSAIVFIEPQASAFPSGNFASKPAVKRQARKAVPTEPSFGPGTDIDALAMGIQEPERSRRRR